MTRGRNRRSSPAQRRARAAADLSFVALRDEIIELDVPAGAVEERIAAALAAVRQALRDQEASELARYTGVARAYDAAARETGADAARLVERVEQQGGAVAELVEWMRLADEAIAHRLGIPALAALLTEPPRVVEVADGVVLLGLFCPRGRLDDRCAVAARWRVVRGPSHVEAAIVGIDEPGAGDDAVAGMLIELAVESETSAATERARAVLLLSPAIAGAVDTDELGRRLNAIAAVRDVVVELVAIGDERDLRPVDAVLAQPELDILFLWVDPAAQWAWRRARAFEKGGGQLFPLASADLPAALAEIDAAVADLVSGSDDGGAAVAGSTLAPAEQEEVAAALDGRSVKVVFVGGNETQAQYHDAIEDDLVALYASRVTVDWFEGWGSSWNVIERAAHGRMNDADAVVVMTMVRTLLGASIRRRAGELGLPWVSCQGRGRQSLMASIEQALLVVARAADGL